MKLRQRIQKAGRKLRRAILRAEPTYYDMFLNEGERFFARLYLHAILERLRAVAGASGSATTRSGSVAGADGSATTRSGAERRDGALEILDAGCQAGRLSVPLALEGHRVTGVDTSGLALRRAERHARECGTSLKLVRADLSRWLARAGPDRFDAVVCTEVLYLRSNHRELLGDLIRVLKPGGLCFISHRPAAYYLVEALQRGDKEAARVVLSSKEGTLFGSYFNWQDREELEGMYRQNGIDLLKIVPIGFLSWLAVNPESLGAQGREALLRTELDSAEACPGGGRYLLVIGRKK